MSELGAGETSQNSPESETKGSAKAKATAGESDCSACGGQGKYWPDVFHVPPMKTCTYCNGTGRVQAEGEKPEDRPDIARYYERYDLELSMAVAQEMIDEWDYARDPHGYCHTRPMLMTLLKAAKPLTQSDKEAGGVE